MCARDYFLINTGTAWATGGENLFGCHGGSFPEEVITRVSLLSTRPNRPQLRVAGEGRGVSGGDGTIDWSVTNTSGVEVSVTKATLRIGTRHTLLQPPPTPVPAFGIRACQARNVPNWPSAEDARQAVLELEYFVLGRSIPAAAQGTVALQSTLGYESTIFRL